MKYNPDLSKVKYYMHLIASHPYSGTEVGHILDDALDVNGKMLRATLVICAGSYGPDFEKKIERIYMLAAMVELTHLISLIHDDIIDEADFRRGKPSIQSKYHKDAAVYAGDFLQARVNYYEAKENLNAAAAILSQTIERMCAGEIGQAICRYKETTSIAEYINNIRGKTVELFKGACRIGSMEAGCNEKIVNNLESIAENLGIMFQFRDDLLDFTSTKAEMGKSTHVDLREGIYTMPVLCALENDKAGELRAILKKNAKESLTDAEISKTEKLVLELGGVDATIKKIQNCQKEIERLLRELPPCKSTSLIDELVKKLAV